MGLRLVNIEGSFGMLVYPERSFTSNLNAFEKCLPSGTEDFPFNIAEVLTITSESAFGIEERGVGGWGDVSSTG